jgi:hypothetical protein
MTQTLAPTVPPGARKTATRYVLYVAAYLVVLLPLVAVLHDGPRTDVTFANDSNWDLRVDLVYDDGSTLPLATIDAHQTGTIQDVWKPDATWRLRWSYGAEATTTVEVSDATLRAAGYRTSAPSDLTARLAADGVAPSP